MPCRATRLLVLLLMSSGARRAAAAPEPSAAACAAGEPPVTREFMREQLPLFANVFARRPDAGGSNAGGTGFFHGLYLWCLVRRLEPLHIIESGAFEGLGTWVLRQAAPSAQIIVVTPAMPGAYRDAHRDSLYFAGAEHFMDFAAVDWDCLNIDKSRTLIFFDDHMSGYRRALEAHARGFVHIAFDDNYRPGSGDNFSPKAACAAGLPCRRAAQASNATCKASGARFVDFRCVGGCDETHAWRLGAADVQAIGASFRRVAATYFEFPPVWPGPWRGVSGHFTQRAFERSTGKPLFNEAEAKPLARSLSSRLPPAAFRGRDAESRAYSYFVYLRLNAATSPSTLHWPASIQLGSYSSPQALPPSSGAQCKRGAPRPSWLSSLTSPLQHLLGWRPRLSTQSGSTLAHQG